MTEEDLRSMIEMEYPLESEGILLQLQEKQLSTFRVNTLKAAPDQVESILSQEGITFTRRSFPPYSYIVEDGRMGSSRCFREGLVYMQSLSSMLPPLLLDPHPGERILDMAAAPGGKTTEIAALSGNKAIIDAVEPAASRADRLRRNLRTLGAKATVIETDARFLSQVTLYDKVLLDAPCSGSGTFQSGRSSGNDIQRLPKLQEDLLSKALRLTARGGLVVYSTCSILARENEEVVRKAIRREGGRIEEIGIEDAPILRRDSGMITIRPTKLYEGFFIAAIRR